MPSKARGKDPLNMFAEAARERAKVHAPLAARMRPRTLEEFVGQEGIVGEGKALRRAIEEDRVPSLVFWGPPGTGKTTLARIIASLTQSHFEAVSAVSAGVADLRRIVGEARDRLGETGQRTILFIDEIHRFNKSQQDTVLPHVEDGIVTMIGATTENPSFEVISALLSRSRVFRLEALIPEQIEELLRRALADEERGIATMKVAVDDGALATLAAVSGGDARIALNALELAAQTAAPDADGVRKVTLEHIEEALQQRAALYDRAGDWHYDIISAFIKSLRGSNPDAALYWLARILEGGEDPLFVARRLVILASEDVGLADPAALQVAVAAQQAVHFIGMPEGFFPLAEATIYLAAAPKSNSVKTAYGRALQDAQATLSEPVPLHLRNAVTPLMKGMGYGADYQYDHDAEDHYSGQEHLPESLAGRRYYTPTEQGAEARIKEWLGKLRGSRLRGLVQATTESRKERETMDIQTPPRFDHPGDLSQRYASNDPRKETFAEPNVRIDLRECEFVRPAAVLWCAIYPLLCKERSSKCELLVPQNMGVCLYLQSVGLLACLQEGGVEVDDRVIGKRDDPQVVLPLTRFQTEENVEELANRALDSLNQRNLGAANLRPLVSEIFAELALNAVQHSESAIGALGFIQFYQTERGRRFVCAVADGGIGIRRSLERNPALRERVTYDWDAIELALRERVSGTGEPTRGIGLYGVAEDMKRPGRRMIIHSGIGMLITSEEVEMNSRRTALFPGTLVYTSISA